MHESTFHSHTSFSRTSDGQPRLPMQRRTHLHPNRNPQVACWHVSYCCIDGVPVIVIRKLSHTEGSKAMHGHTNMLTNIHAHTHSNSTGRPTEWAEFLHLQGRKFTDFNGIISLKRITCCLDNLTHQTQSFHQQLSPIGNMLVHCQTPF